MSGPNRKKALMGSFGSVRGVREASVEGIDATTLDDDLARIVAPEFRNDAARTREVAEPIGAGDHPLCKSFGGSFRVQRDEVAHLVEFPGGPGDQLTSTIGRADASSDLA